MKVALRINREAGELDMRGSADDVAAAKAHVSQLLSQVEAYFELKKSLLIEHFVLKYS
jgi:hypothetical protein